MPEQHSAAAPSKDPPSAKFDRKEKPIASATPRWFRPSGKYSCLSMEFQRLAASTCESFSKLVERQPELSRTFAGKTPCQRQKNRQRSAMIGSTHRTFFNFLTFDFHKPQESAPGRMETKLNQTGAITGRIISNTCSWPLCRFFERPSNSQAFPAPAKTDAGRFPAPPAPAGVRFNPENEIGIHRCSEVV